jgi:hypothetical protein
MSDTICAIRGYHRTDSYQWAHLPVTLSVRCKDCDERLWHNDPPPCTEREAAAFFDALAMVLNGGT